MGYMNPLLKLPAAVKLQALPAPQRRLIAELLTELRHDANAQAENSWRKRKGFQAAYWRVVSTYARHTAHCLRHQPAESMNETPAAQAEGTLL